jgi:sulfatase maturation enzyme AslB (radical SAM superfamily)
MPNLMITTYCNFSCKYCFGREMIGSHHPKTHMSWEMFLNLVNWIEKAEIPELSIHLMGGEPTLNPLFFKMLMEILDRKRTVLVFSNAATQLDPKQLQEVATKKVHWVINCNHPSEYKERQLEYLKNNLAILGKNASVTFNVTSGNMDYDYVFDYIKTYDLDRRIKIGVTLPTLNHNNEFAQWEEFPAIADQILKLHEAIRAINGHIDFECGVPLCVFTDDQYKKLENPLVSHCNSRLDITPWGEVINCLPLCKMARISYDRFPHYGEARDWFAKLLMPYRQVGSSADCLTCSKHVEHTCNACYAYGIAQFNKLPLPALPGEAA